GARTGLRIVRRADLVRRRVAVVGRPAAGKLSCLPARLAAARGDPRSSDATCRGERGADVSVARAVGTLSPLPAAAPPAPRDGETHRSVRRSGVVLPRPGALAPAGAADPAAAG